MDKQYQVATKRVCWALAGLMMLLGSNAGCDRGITLIPTTGLVTINGQPLVEAAVTFVPVDGSPIASGVTDAEGRFTLSTVNRPGAVPGEHAVIVSKQRMRRDNNGREQGFEFLTPKKYARPDTSGLKEIVDEDNHEFVFEISSKP